MRGCVFHLGDVAWGVGGQGVMDVPWSRPCGGIVAWPPARRVALGPRDELLLCEKVGRAWWDLGSLESCCREGMSPGCAMMICLQGALVPSPRVAMAVYLKGALVVWLKGAMVASPSVPMVVSPRVAVLVCLKGALVSSPKLVVVVCLEEALVASPRVAVVVCLQGAMVASPRVPMVVCLKGALVATPRVSMVVSPRVPVFVWPKEDGDVGL